MDIEPKTKAEVYQCSEECNQKCFVILFDGQPENCLVDQITVSWERIGVWKMLRIEHD